MNTIRLGGLTAWVDYPESKVAQAKRDLTFQKFEYHEGLYTPIAAYAEDSGIFFVPRWYSQGIEPIAEDKRRTGVKIRTARVKELTTWAGVDQKKFVTDAIENMAKNTRGGFCLAPCGVGKTFMGLEITNRLSVAALVVVPRINLVQQWKKEAAESFRAETGEPLICNEFHGDEKEIAPPITIGVINSLVKVTDPHKFDPFGLIIFDECHHLPADTWLQFAAKMRARYMIGLTAELVRSDSLEKLFGLMLGPVIAQGIPATVRGGKVWQMKIGPWNNGVAVLTRCHAVIANWLARIPARNQYIARVVGDMFRDGRNIFVFSELRDHLKVLMGECEKIGVPASDMGLFIGGLSHEELQVGLSKRVTFSTYQMGQEGTNTPEKDLAIVATPPHSTGLRQLYGRISRELPGKTKPSPVLVDLIDLNEGLKEAGQRREKRWVREGLEIQKFA